MSIASKIKKIVATACSTENKKINCEDISLEHNLELDLGADWLINIEIFFAIEDEFEYEFNDNDLEKMKTVGDLIEHIKLVA